MPKLLYCEYRITYLALDCLCNPRQGINEALVKSGFDLSQPITYHDDNVYGVRTYMQARGTLNPEDK